MKTILLGGVFMLLLSLLLSILCAVACYALGVPKGYGGALCGVAGFFGGILAIIISLCCLIGQKKSTAHK